MKLLVVTWIVFGLFSVGILAQEVELRPEGVILPKTNGTGGPEGAIRYNDVGQFFEGFDGEQWLRISEPSSGIKLISAMDLVPGNSSDANARDLTAYFTSGSAPAFYSSFELRTGMKVDSMVVIFRDNSTTRNIQILTSPYLINEERITIYPLGNVALSSGSSLFNQKMVVPDPLSIVGSELITFYLLVQCLDNNGNVASWPGADIQFHRALLYYSKL